MPPQPGKSRHIPHGGSSSDLTMRDRPAGSKIGVCNNSRPPLGIGARGIASHAARRCPTLLQAMLSEIVCLLLRGGRPASVVCRHPSMAYMPVEPRHAPVLPRWEWSRQRGPTSGTVGTCGRLAAGPTLAGGIRCPADPDHETCVNREEAGLPVESGLFDPTWAHIAGRPRRRQRRHPGTNCPALSPLANRHHANAGQA